MLYTNPMWWEYFIFGESQWYLWRLAGAEISVCREEETWHGFCRSLRWEKRDTSCTGPLQEIPSVQTALQTNVIKIKTAALRPFLPEKPFLISLGGIKLYPGMKTTLKLEIPPQLRLIAEKSAGSAPKHIFSFVPFMVKETWCGKNSMDGYLCSSLPVNINGKTAGVADDKNAQENVLCPLSVHCNMTIRNRTKSVLELKTIPLYASGLSVYEKGGKLISDAPLVDVLENNFHMTVETARNEHSTLLVQGNKSDLRFINQGTRIIKNIAGL